MAKIADQVPFVSLGWQAFCRRRQGRGLVGRRRFDFEHCEPNAWKPGVTSVALDPLLGKGAVYSGVYELVSPTLETSQRTSRVGDREIDRWGNVACFDPAPDPERDPIFGEFWGGATLGPAAAPFPLRTRSSCTAIRRDEDHLPRLRRPHHVGNRMEYWLYAAATLSRRRTASRATAVSPTRNWSGSSTSGSGWPRTSCPLRSM